MVCCAIVVRGVMMVRHTVICEDEVWLVISCVAECAGY